MQEAEQQTTVARAHLADVETVLERALAVAGHCHRHYEQAPDLVKRQINQGFFVRLLIDQDGSVEHAELTEPFAQLLAPERVTAMDGGAQHAPDAPGRLPAPRAPGATSPAPLGTLGRPGRVLADVTAGGRTNSPDDYLVGVGVNVDGLVELTGFEPVTP